MIKYLLLVCFTTMFVQVIAQHCPWDCAGMILFSTPLPQERVYKMKPVLVDENKDVITDTMYGTGTETYDRCDFLFYDDFTKLRQQKIALHHWYGYDTVYHFAAGRYIVKYNFCKYADRPLYLRYEDPLVAAGSYHYIEITRASRIHLHEYSSQLFDRKTREIERNIQPFVLVLHCQEWGIPKKECRN